MVSDLNVTGRDYPSGLVSLGLTPSAAPDSAETPPTIGGHGSGSSKEDSAIKINASAKSLASLSDVKDASAQVAKNIRETGKKLDHAEELLNGMDALVASVKNYPPFPQGNEDRVQYLNSIDGLRKELQSMTVPPVKPEFQPVFYPRKDVYPPLDAKVPSDAAVLAFGDAVKTVKGEVNTARAELEAQAKRAAETATAAELPRPPEEAQAHAISTIVAGQLNGKAQPLTGGSDVFSQV